jgi:ABC-type dipeptide/oligopeptide/nickel transport system ATPase subunit
MRTLSLENATVTYPGKEKVHAVRSVSFTVSEAETVALVGESGSGKSSTARVVAGLQRLTSGKVEWTGRPDGTFRARAIPGGDAYVETPRVQMVFQHPDQSLNPAWTVRRSIAEPLVRLGVSRDYIESSTVDLLERVGLDAEFLTRHPRDLSGGQAQRVAIARALIASPNLIVLDEPTSSLDQTVRARLLVTLAELQEEIGTGYLMVTHDMSSVRRLADRVLVMNSGRILEQGPTDIILGAPLHPYTRALIDAVPPVDPRVAWDPAAQARDLAEPASACPVGGSCGAHTPGLNEVSPGHLVECTAQEAAA